jgi:hypothetical protein
MFTVHFNINMLILLAIISDWLRIVNLALIPIFYNSMIYLFQKLMPGSQCAVNRKHFYHLKDELINASVHSALQYYHVNFTRHCEPSIIIIWYIKVDINLALKLRFSSLCFLMFSWFKIVSRPMYERARVRERSSTSYNLNHPRELTFLTAL